jgi:hypothetical protein
MGRMGGDRGRDTMSLDASGMRIADAWWPQMERFLQLKVEDGARRVD